MPRRRLLPDARPPRVAWYASWRHVRTTKRGGRHYHGVLSLAHWALMNRIFSTGDPRSHELVDRLTSNLAKHRWHGLTTGRGRIPQALQGGSR